MEMGGELRRGDLRGGLKIGFGWVVGWMVLAGLVWFGLVFGSDMNEVKGMGSWD